MFSVHNASHLFRFSARFWMGFFFQTKHLWNFFSYIFLWIVRFNTVWGLNWLKIAHIWYKGFLLFVFDRFKLPNIKNGLLLSTLPRSFNHLKTPYKVGCGCLVWLTICDPLIPTFCNSTTHFFLTITALVLFCYHFWIYGLYID